MKKLWKVLIALVLTLQGVLSVLPVSAAPETAYQNVFNKNDLDNWMKALSHNGQKLVNESNYANMFTTHKITVHEGDVITWGLFGKDEYVMELYDEDDNFIRKVYSTELEIEEEETTVIGVGGKSYTEVKASYEVSDANCAYARILGNISTIGSFMVFINLPGGLASWPDTYVPYEGNEDPDNPLYQKSALFVGDSIVNAVKDPDHPYYGWAGRIGTTNDMDWKNAGISSATISTALESSYPENRVVNQLRENAGTDYDYVILQGGMNDSYAEREIGEISESYDPKGFDIETFSGAMEELLYAAATLYEGAKIGFIVTYATPNSNWGGLTADNAAYFRRAKEICEKWEVPYIDLYEGGVEEDGEWKSYSYDILKVESGENMYASDPHEIHIGSKGYDVISPYIAEWMRTLQPYVAPQDLPLLIDDTDSRFVYSNGDANNGGWEGGGSGDPDATEHWSNTPGATVEISFNGTVFELYGIKAPNHSMFTVSIDGGEEVKGDAYAASRTDGNELYYSSEDAGIELEAGDHTAVLTVLEEANEAASNVLGLSVTYAQVYGGEPTEPEEPEFPGYSIVEDMQITDSDELFKVKYNGNWSGGTYYPGMFHDGYEHYAHSGDSYEMRFVGTQVEIWASQDPGHGIYTVTIDGEDAGEAMGTGESRVHQQLIYTSPELENTEHTIKVELVGQEDMAIQLDYLKVYHEEMAPTTITLDRSEVTMIPGGSTTLNASVEPWVATNDDIIWTSSNNAVVSVEDGVLNAAEVESKETVIITAMAAADERVYAQATITVDPSLAVMNAYVGNEKLLDIAEDYDELAVGNDPTYEGTAWRGDQLNSKVVVASMSRPLTNVEVTASDFTNENGAVLSADNFDIKWLKEIDANIGRGNSSAPVKEFPDMIHKGGAKDIEANDVQFAWIKINVPEDTQAGTYTGTITVSADEVSDPFVLRYTIEVIDLVQPEAGATDIQIWQHPFSVANYYLGLGSQPSGGISNDLAEDFYFTEEHFNLMRASMEEYVEMGGHDAVANIVEEAWNHQSYYSDPSMVKWTKKTDGSWEFDYTWYDAWIEFIIECGVLDPENGIGQIKCYSIVPWNNQIAYYDEASGTTVKESHTPGSESWKAMWEPFLEDFIQHSKEKGWFEITYISMDERGLSELEPAVEVIESVTDEEGNHFKISSALNYAAPEYYDFTDRIDDISINLGNTTNVQQMKDLSEHRRELGLNTTFYTCTGDYPSNFTISDPGDNYWDVWYTMTLGTDGYMRWAWDNFVYDMHGDITYRYWEPGDGWFFYPLEREEADMSETVGFYSTPRYELFKQGVRDVAKAKYLLASEDVSEEQKEALRATVENLQRPAGTTSYGSRVPANEEQRMLVHSETQRALEATNALAREIAGSASEEEGASEASTQALQTMVEKAIALGSEDEALNAAIEAAQAVLAKEAPTATEVVTALLDLSEAMQALNTDESTDALRADVQATIDFINENILNDVEGLRPGKVQALRDAVAAAQDVVNDPDATADELKAANKAMTKAAQELWEIVTKAELEALIEAANGYLDGDYTAESLEALQAAITAAQAVVENDDATTVEVTEAITNLSNAIAGLVEEAGVDKSALAYEIELVNEMLANIDNYVPSSVEGLADKLASAQQVYDDANAAQDAVDAATQALREARLNARTKADVSALEELIAYVNSLDLSGYSRASVAALNQAIAQNKLLLSDPEVSQDKVDAAVTEIQNAIDALEPVSETAGSTTADSTNTAAASTMGMMAALMAAAGAAAVMAYRRKRS